MAQQVSYLMEFDNSDLIRERLEYKILKNRGCCFDIEEDKVEINSNIFESAEFWKKLKDKFKCIGKAYFSVDFAT